MTGSWLLADALQPASYSPVRQSISVLAGQAGAYRWIVTGALFAAGGCYLLLANQLTVLPVAARAGLAVTGVAALGIALCPEPAHGSTRQHLLFTAMGAVALAAWPGLLAGRSAASPRPAPFGRRVSLTVCAIFLGLLGWTFAETHVGDDLGLAERLTSSIQICWPLLVAVFLWRSGTGDAVSSPAVSSAAAHSQPAAVPSGPAGRARNSYADLVRTVAIVAVVFGHWLATGVVRHGGRYVGVDALGVIRWGSWVTLVLQVVPVFFLVGGYANGASWRRHRAAGELWSGWVRARVLRLLIPTSGYLLLIAIAVLAAELAGVNRDELASAGWAVALHLWFLAAYVVVLLCTPVLYAAQRRWGLWVPAAMGALAVLVDLGVVGGHWRLIGWANYLLVWGTFHQLGFAWHDGTLTARRRPLLLTVGAVAALVGLIWWGPYPVSMVGVPGAKIQNASPPSTALLAFGLAQAGVVLLAEPAAARWLAGHRRTRARIAVAGRLTMPVYLWHMVPVVIVIVGGYPKLVGLPAVGSARWWAQRPVWIAALTLVLGALLAILAGLLKAVRRPRPVASAERRRPARSATAAAGLLIAGVVCAAAGIGVLAVRGFAPHGRLDPFSLLAVAAGLALVRASAPRRGVTRSAAR